MAHHHEWATAIIPACAALAGAGLVGWLAACRERAARRHAILREQLEKFYSPMVALRARIRAKSETRVRIHNAADEEWRRQVARDLGDNQLRELEDSMEPQLEKLIEEDARRLREELLPLYREMVDLFTRSMWLAEPSTRTQFALLVDHVEVFERFLAGTIPKGWRNTSITGRRVWHRSTTTCRRISTACGAGQTVRDGSEWCAGQEWNR